MWPPMNQPVVGQIHGADLAGIPDFNPWLRDSRLIPQSAAVERQHLRQTHLGLGRSQAGQDPSGGK